MKAAAVLLYLVMVLANVGCVSQENFPKVSGRWSFEEFTKCYREVKQRDDLPPLFFPFFSEKAFAAFEKEALPADVVVEFQIDSPDYWIYRYCLTRGDQIVDQREFRLKKRI